MNIHRISTIATRALSALPVVRSLSPDVVTPVDELEIHRKCERALRHYGINEMPENPYPVGDLRREIWLKRTIIILKREAAKRAELREREARLYRSSLPPAPEADWLDLDFDFTLPELAPVIPFNSKGERSQ